MPPTATAPSGAAPPRLQDLQDLRVTVSAAELPPHAPLALYTALRELLGDDEVFLFESLAGPDQDCRAAVVGAEVLARITVRGGELGIDGQPGLVARLRALAERTPGAPWEFLRALDGSFDVRTELPADTFAFGFLGIYGYEAAWHMEELPARAPGQLPDITLTAFRHTVHYDLAEGGVRHLRASAAEFGDAGALGSRLADLVGRLDPAPGPVPEAPRAHTVSGTVPREEFESRARRCLDHIAAGDVYQIQIGHRVDVRTALGPADAYRRLRRGNPSPYMFLAPWADRTLVGASPELLFRIEGRRLTMRPIAGTAPRDADPAEDARRASALAADEKERAEHIMLVDLCRNDVARVSGPGTLAVESMMSVERFSHVHHLVSTVHGELADGEDAWSTLRATFPAGTMTGAPKVRAMELIHEIEGRPRGAYAGAIGLVDVRGRAATLALCIRTAVYDGATGTYSLQASAGVVADSTARGEWRETLIKMGAVYTALTGEELTDDVLTDDVLAHDLLADDVRTMGEGCAA
ncbi:MULTISPECIES: anthranilate synthase component I family protein [unclassified Streptomyces]|uniref:anthranilate synthase component I family protein n=1 Tax=unclassified Streptomyces TaxID=2593676 RepID=UPI00278BC773|nr:MULTISPECIES: anthranilate synthase component I family protein [unclassified Streptomyces]